MFGKLDSVELRLEQIESDLGRGELSPQELTKLSKERASIVDVVEAYRTYKGEKSNLQQAREMLEESDPELKELAKQEIESAETKIDELEDQLRILTLPKDPNDERNVILEIRAGTGGEEAALFAADLLRMYNRFSDKQG